MLSVALCTYNGVHYIADQLQSILTQTMPVDEIVICDDGSIDDTLGIIEQIKASTSIPIHIHRNEKPIGVSNNFQKAINLCQGDIIFLSDQDDIWIPQKVQTIIDFFNNNKHVSTVFTNAQLIDDNNNPIGNYLFDYFFDTISHTLFDKGLVAERFAYSNCATGATMAIHKKRYGYIQFSEYCGGEILHDYAIAIKAIANNALAYIDTPLINYRIHSNQSVGLNCEVPPINNWRKPFIGNYIPFLQIAKSETLDNRIHFFEFRQQTKYSPHGALKAILQLPTYLKYYNFRGLSLMLFDIFTSLKHTLHQIIKKCNTTA